MKFASNRVAEYNISVELINTFNCHILLLEMCTKYDSPRKIDSSVAI